MRVYADRVKEPATTAGTGTFTMSGTASDPSQQTTAAGIGNGNSSYFYALDSVGGTWLCFDGTVTVSGSTTLSRDKFITGSSGAGNNVTFANNPVIYGDFPAFLAAFVAAGAALALASFAGAM